MVQVGLDFLEKQQETVMPSLTACKGGKGEGLSERAPALVHVSLK